MRMLPFEETPLLLVHTHLITMIMPCRKSPQPLQRKAHAAPAPQWRAPGSHNLLKRILRAGISFHVVHVGFEAMLLSMTLP